MATFNKRGYKEPKPKTEKLDNSYIEDVNVDEKDSATAKAFDTLDQSASRAEDFVAKNQKYILELNKIYNLIFLFLDVAILIFFL